MKRILIICGKVILAISLVCILTVMVVYRDLLSTVLSTIQISEAPAYRSVIYGDFGLEEYYKTGSASYEELQNYCFEALGLSFLNQNQANNFDHGCSGFFARTPEGDYILCQNYDTYPDQQLPVVIETHAPSSGKKVIGLANCGYFVREKGFYNLIDKISVGASPYLCMDGMNEHGLAIMIATASGSSGYKEQDDRLVMVDQTIPTALLNKAENVEEAIAWLEGITINESSHPSHFLLGDAYGNSAVVEWIDGEMQVIRTDKEYQIFSNFVLYDNEELIGNGSNRYREYEKVLEATGGVITEEAALELLKDNTLGNHACFSVVYNLTDKTMKVTFHNDYENVYEFKIAK